MTAMHRRLRIVAVAAFAVTTAATAAGVARAADPTAIPPAPTEFVTDHAGFLSPAYASSLTRELEDYERGTGHQLIVWIDKTTGGVPIEDWAVKAFTAWGIGRKGHDDGVALFIFSDDRRVRIAVGYGLEGAVPDARAGRIIQNDMAPRIRAGDRDGAVKAGVDALKAAIGGAPEPRRPGASRVALVKTGFLGLVVFFMVVFFLVRRHPWALLLLGSGGGSRWGGDSNWWGGGGGGWGGGGGGGGFSGGGGSTGGGGASGGW
jgi:uncharacterized protein